MTERSKLSSRVVQNKMWNEIKENVCEDCALVDTNAGHYSVVAVVEDGKITNEVYVVKTEALMNCTSGEARFPRIDKVSSRKRQCGYERKSC